MSLTNRMATTYAKSLFNNGINAELRRQSEKKESLQFFPSEITATNELNQLLKAPNIFILGEELLILKASLISSKDLRSFFLNPTYVEQEKLEIFLILFPGLTNTMKAFLRVLTERKILFLIPKIANEYSNLLLKFKNCIKVRLITADYLEEEFGPTLLESLKKITNSKDIILTFGYNPGLLGGLILEYNSIAMDASLFKEFSLFFNDI